MGWWLGAAVVAVLLVAGTALLVRADLIDLNEVRRAWSGYAPPDGETPIAQVTEPTQPPATVPPPTAVGGGTLRETPVLTAEPASAGGDSAPSQSDAPGAETPPTTAAEATAEPPTTTAAAAAPPEAVIQTYLERWSAGRLRRSLRPAQQLGPGVDLRATSSSLATRESPTAPGCWR